MIPITPQNVHLAIVIGIIPLVLYAWRTSSKLLKLRYELLEIDSKSFELMMECEDLGVEGWKDV